MDIKLIAWLSGILEGEGCFRIVDDITPEISVAMNDEDIIKKVAKLLNRPYKGYRYSTTRVSYRVHICGKDAVGWLFTLYPFMGSRRKFKFNEIINKWKLIKPTKSKSGFCDKHGEISGDNLIMNHRTKICRGCLRDNTARYLVKKKLINASD